MLAGPIGSEKVEVAVDVDDLHIVRTNFRDNSLEPPASLSGIDVNLDLVGGSP